ncbi:conjugal transfer protein [Arthrobacter woluwensis]|uniref:conjugal transfer protein n=1 Tax=Arthrobacter woluwensis TaxID=156980 RepID=UPI0038169D12
MLWKKTKPAPEEKADAAERPAEPASGVRTEGWTQGSMLGRRAVTAAVVGCLLSGPIALAAASSRGTNVPQNDGPTEAIVDTPGKAQAGAFAAQFVLAWLKSSQLDPTALKSFGDFPQSMLPQQPAQASDAVVASIEQGTVPRIWSVVVSVRILEPRISDDGKSTKAWTLRWFRVPVAVQDGALVVGTLPAPLPAPARMHSFPGLSYRETLGATSPASTTISAFLTALLTGNGDVSRYLSPRATGIQALTPAPGKSLRVVSITATKAPSEAPSDGEKLQAIASISLTDFGGQERMSDIPLDLTARAGRWEIESMPALPQITPPIPSTTTPSPTETPNS